MSWLESLRRSVVRALGSDMRWLRQELRARGIKVHLTDACLRELAEDADAAAKRSCSTGAAGYVSELRGQLAARAEFIRTWTMSDDDIDLQGLSRDHLVKVARKYALPRPWRLSEPVAHECARPTPTYLYWARAS